jgi:Tannase and feruloyl esterase
VAIAPVEGRLEMRIKHNLILVVMIAVQLSAFSSGAQAQTVENPTAKCDAMKDADFRDVQDAPTKITDSKFIDAKADMPAYCKVNGYVAPQVGFDIRLPASNWNGKYLMVGCGGMCGQLFSELGICDPPLKRGYACITTDMGHKSNFVHDALWSYNNLQANVDFAYRATHVATLAGKAVTERYYRTNPAHSYFVGCSTGGRQGFVEAQYFPWDFDGIIAGAAPHGNGPGSLNTLWVVKAASVLTPSAIQTVHEGALAACDLDDGVKDGIIGNPHACRFDPSKLLCKSGSRGSCLTAAQVEGVKKIYSGLRTSNGEDFHLSIPVGTELDWIPFFVHPDGTPGFLQGQATEYSRYGMGGNPSWNPNDLDVERDYKRGSLQAPLAPSSNPDLRSFKSTGGKLISYHGSSDIWVNPGPAVDYYETVERTMGGRNATQDFFRLFMMPGMGHCAGGPGADTADFLGPLEAWVERQQAPDMVLSAHIDHDSTNPELVHSAELIQTMLHFTPLPADLSGASFTRPLYPYPQRAVYKGSGDPKRAENFKAVDSK